MKLLNLNKTQKIVTANKLPKKRKRKRNSGFLKRRKDLEKMLIKENQRQAETEYVARYNWGLTASSCSFQPLVSQCIRYSPMEQSKYPQPFHDSHCSLDLSHMCSYPPLKNAVFSRCCRQVQSPNDVMQKIEKRQNNTQTTTEKQTNNGFHNTKKQENEVH